MPPPGEAIGAMRDEITREIKRLLRAAWAARDAGEREAEDRAYLRAIELDDGTDVESRGDPDLPPFRLRPYILHARNLRDRGDAVGARNVLERAAGWWPGDADLHLSLGMCHRSLQDWERAASAFQRSIGIKPRPYTCIFLATVLDKLGRHDESLHWLQHSLVIDPNYEESHYNLACVLERNGDLDAAYRHLRRAIELDPDYAEALEKLAAVSRRMPS